MRAANGAPADRLQSRFHRAVVPDAGFILPWDERTVQAGAWAAAPCHYAQLPACRTLPAVSATLLPAAAALSA